MLIIIRQFKKGQKLPKLGQIKKLGDISSFYVLLHLSYAAHTLSADARLHEAPPMPSFKTGGGASVEATSIGKKRKAFSVVKLAQLAKASCCRLESVCR